MEVTMKLRDEIIENTMNAERLRAGTQSEKMRGRACLRENVRLNLIVDLLERGAITEEEATTLAHPKQEASTKLTGGKSPKILEINEGDTFFDIMKRYPKGVKQSQVEATMKELSLKLEDGVFVGA